MNAFRRRQQVFARLTNREQSNQSRDDTLLYILGGIVAMFFICNIPGESYLIISLFKSNHFSCHEFTVHKRNVKKAGGLSDFPLNS
jgi:hypothetical protein